MQKKQIYEVRFQVKALADLKTLRKLLEENNMEKPNFSELARNLNKARNTVKRHFYIDDVEVKKRQRTSALDAHKEQIDALLQNSVKRFKYISHLYDYMVDTYEINVSYSSFRRYITKHFKDTFKKNKQYTTGPRFETPAGQQGQFDMKEDMQLVTVDGEYKTINIGVLTYGYSRFRYREVLPDKSTASILTFLAHAFEEAGGVIQELVIDNPKSLVTKPRHKKEPAILQPTFEAFAKDYGFTVLPCYPRRPETKGKVEAPMKEVDALLGYNGEYKDIKQMDDRLKQLTSKNNHTISQATEVPPLLLFEKEKEHLSSLPPQSVRAQYQKKFFQVTVNNEALINFDKKLYAVPSRYKGRQLNLIKYGEELQIYCNTELIESYQITEQKLNYKERYYVDHTIENSRMQQGSDEMQEQALKNFELLQEVQHGR